MGCLPVGEGPFVARRAVGDLGKRKAADTSPVRTVGKPLGMADFEGAPSKGVGKQARLGT